MFTDCAVCRRAQTQQMVNHALDGKHHPKNATSGKEPGSKTEVGGFEGVGQE